MSLAILTGAPGSGKTTILPGLCAALPGVVVLDMDELLDAAGRLAGVDLSSPAAAGRWPAWDDLCLSFVAIVLRAGHDVLLLSPLEPAQVRRTDLGPVRWAVLDCSDATRASRLAPRSVPGLAEEAAADAESLRRLGFDVLRNDGLAVDEAVDLVAGWFRAGRAAGR